MRADLLGSGWGQWRGGWQSARRLRATAGRWVLEDAGREVGCWDGLAEAMRARSLEVTPHAMLSRAEAGVVGGCLIVNLPGSPTGAVECFEVVAPAVPHALELLRGTARE